MTNALSALSARPVSRRGFLRSGLTAFAGLAASGGATILGTQDAMAALFSTSVERMAGQIGGERRLAFRNTHTGEELVTTFWRRGFYEQAALDEINYIMRDFRCGSVKPINTGLLNLLSVLRHKMGVSEPVNIISGYRSPETNARLRATGGGGVASNSFHIRGMAIDVRMPGTATYGIARVARNLGVGGVGYYSDSDFVHVDVGPPRTW